jgi:iron complex outermembrane receptor protein
MGERAIRASTRRAAEHVAATVLVAMGLAAADSARGAEKEASATRVGEVVVTAQKREERLLDVPISVAVVGGATLEKLNLNQATDLSYLVPNVTFSDESGHRAFSFFIRGIGTTTYSSESIESSTAYVVDGVVYGQGGAAQGDLPDIERIEVLRGPQGTLFGKNASGGVINVTTRSTAQRFTAEGSASWATPKDEIKTSLLVSGPITDEIGFLVSYRSNRHKGIVYNAFDGRWLNDRDDWGVRGRLEFGKGQRLKLTVIGDYWRLDNNCCIWTATHVGEPLSYIEEIHKNLGGTGIDPGHLVQNINGESYTRITNAGASAQVDYDLGGGYDFTAISAYRIWNSGDWPDTDNQPINIFDIDYGAMRQHQFSQEFRIASPKGKFIDYVAGLYYFRQHAKTINGQVLDLRPVLYVGRYVDVVGNTENYAVFGQGNVNFTDDFRLILGARWLTERGDAQSLRAFDAIDGSPFESNAREKTDRAWVWRVGLQYDLSDDVNVFATVTRGYKGGGFNTTIDTSHLDSVGPEKPTSYEVGLRSQFPALRLAFNATGFITKTTNFQVNSLFTDPATLVQTLNITNVGEADVKGIELDAIWQPLERADWRLTASFGYLDAKFGKFATAPCYPFQTEAEGCDYSGGGGVQDATGQRLPFAPKYSAALISDYETPLGRSGWTLRITGDISYKSKRFINLPARPEWIAPSLTLVNAVVSVGPGNGRWRASAFVQNLFDKHYANREFPAGLEFNPSTFGQDVTEASRQGWVPYEAQRIVGVKLDLKY